MSGNLTAHALPTRTRWKHAIQQRLPLPLLSTYRLFRNGDYRHLLRFLFDRQGRLSFADRRTFVRRLMRVSRHVPCEHFQSEMLAVAQAVFATDASVPGVVVEAGCYKGGSTAKLSIAAKMAGRKLYAFDSFQGIPENTEDHGRNLYGGTAAFAKGDYSGTLEEVRANVTRWGEISACEFVPGYFDDSMPGFDRPVVAAFLDVDLAASTRTCLKHLYPLLVPGGTIFSQDGHLPLVVKEIQSEQVWTEIHYPRPALHGAGRQKLVWLQKPTDQPCRSQGFVG